MSETLTGRHGLGEDEPVEEPRPESRRSAEPERPAARAEPSPVAPTEEQVTCPECGTVATVALTRRDSADFCVQCDFPLFWTPSKIVLDTDTISAESLRRLPGTAGRVTVGSVACPHCAEVNLVGAEVCVRCGGLMEPPRPEPVVQAPAASPAAEPEPRTPVWVWVVAAATLVVLAALVAYVVARG